MAKKTKLAYKIGRTVKTTRFVPGYPVGIPRGAWVEIVATRPGLSRYQVKAVFGDGALYWVDADAVGPLGV